MITEKGLYINIFKELIMDFDVSELGKRKCIGLYEMFTIMPVHIYGDAFIQFVKYSLFESENNF